MRIPTKAYWNLLKERRKEQQQPLPGLPYDLFLADDDDGAVAPPPARVSKRRQFRRLDETWAQRLLADPEITPAGRLVIVLLAEADFHQQIKITRAIEKAARLTRHQKRRALEHLERQGYVAVEWRGRGRAPIVTPLHLVRQPSRK